MKFDLKNVDFKKVAGVASAVMMGIVAIGNALADQKKEQEFEDMKKTLKELSDSQNK